jgi:hypothetical protein
MRSISWSESPQAGHPEYKVLKNFASISRVREQWACLTQPAPSSKDVGDGLSITHMLSAKHEADLNVGES